MPDRYGDPEEESVVVDMESMRKGREAAIRIAEAEANRRKYQESRRQSRQVHQSLSTDQSKAMAEHRRQTAEQAETWRREARIANCGLCDDQGYRIGTATVCDHIDHRPSAARGMALVKQMMGWDTNQRNSGADPASSPTAERTDDPTPIHPPGPSEGDSEPPSPDGVVGPW